MASSPACAGVGGVRSRCPCPDVLRRSESRQASKGAFLVFGANRAPARVHMLRHFHRFLPGLSVKCEPARLSRSCVGRSRALLRKCPNCTPDTQLLSILRCVFGSCAMNVRTRAHNNVGIFFPRKRSRKTRYFQVLVYGSADNKCPLVGETFRARQRRPSFRATSPTRSLDFLASPVIHQRGTYG